MKKRHVFCAEEALDVLAKFPMVTIEKYQGQVRGNGTFCHHFTKTGSGQT